MWAKHLPALLTMCYARQARQGYSCITGNGQKLLTADVADRDRSSKTKVGSHCRVRRGTAGQTHYPTYPNAMQANAQHRPGHYKDEPRRPHSLVRTVRVDRQPPPNFRAVLPLASAASRQVRGCTTLRLATKAKAGSYPPQTKHLQIRIEEYTYCTRGRERQRAGEGEV